MPRTRYAAPALEKGLDILELLAGEEDGLTQNEVATRLGRTAGQIFRMLEVLERRDYIRRAAQDGRYRLSLRLFEMGHRHPPIRRLLEAALGEMRRLAETTDQSAHMSAYFDRRLVVIANVSGGGTMGFGVKLGAHFPFRPDRISAKVLSAFEEPHPDAPMRRELLHDAAEDERLRILRQLARIRRSGHAQEASATIYGVTDLCHPIIDMEGRAVAALVVPYLRMRDNPTTLEETRKLAAGAAAAISRRLGAGEVEIRA